MVVDDLLLALVNDSLHVLAYCDSPVDLGCNRLLLLRRPADTLYSRPVEFAPLIVD